MTARDHSVGALDIPVRTGDGPAPLSFGQELLWLTDRAFPGTTVWNVARPYRLRGALDAGALQRAFDALAARHDALRTVFVSTIEGPRQVVRAAGEVPIRHVDLSSLSAENRFAEADRLAWSEATTPFDLAADTPLRVLLVRLADDDRLLCITTHHIVSDGWSKNVMFRDLSRFYAAFRDGVEPGVEPLPIGWSDYAAWERSEEHQAALADGLRYWREQLRAAPPSLELPTDRVRPRLQGFRAERSVTTLPRPLVDALLRRARENDATLYMALLTAYVVLLHRYSGQDDIVVGSPIVGRMHEETEALIGFFANTLVLRNRVDDDPTFAELLSRVRETCLDAYDRQEIPVEQLLMELQKDRQLTFAPLFNVILTMEDVLPDELAFPGVVVEPIDRDERATKFDLTLYASAVPDGLQLTLWYRTDLFAPQTADRMLAHLRRLIEAGVDDPSARISALPILTEAERRVATAPMALDPHADGLRPVQVQFAEAAARSPRATALVGADVQLSYAELDRNAEVLASALRRRGAGPGSLVGLGLDRSVDAVVGMLGILKSGAAYVPLTPDLPPARMAQQIAESGLRLCVSATSFAARFSDLELVLLDRLPDPDDAAVASRPAGLDDPAYVIFTSGSTGTPKGVVVTHRNLAAYVSAIRRRLGVTPDDPLVFATVTSPAADLGNTAIFPALTSGGTLAVVPPEATAEAAAFAAWTAAHPIDVLKITPAHLGALLGSSQDPRRLPRRWLILGGEACPWELVERVRRVGACRVLNHYGPTETTVGACAFEVGEPAPADERPATVPIGFPLADASCYVLDRHGEPVPDGVPGELYIGGAGVARGYLNRPELTAERFLPDPFGAGRGAMYRTGDRVRRLAGGELEFLGRLDGQVKVRGYRVELGEIESVLREHPAIAAAAAVVRAVGSGETSIVAYVVPRDATQEVDARAWLADRLPDYMLPAAIVPIECLPLTTNGKIDRQALPDPALHAGSSETFVAPRTATEATIATIWAETLGVDRVGVTTDFLELGFHSILAIRALDTLGQAFGIRVPIRSFFEASTIEELAVVVDAELRNAADQELESTLALVDGMSDEDVESLLVEPVGGEERT